MGLLSKLGLVNDTDSKPEVKVESKKFPTSDSQLAKEPFSFDPTPLVKPLDIFPDKGTYIDEKVNPYLSQLETMYNSEFTKLNKPDVDFFELYQMLMKANNLDSLEALKMAYNMCSSMNSNLTYKMLDEQANQYAKSVMDLYNTAKLSGENKLEDLKSKKLSESAMIQDTIDKLEQDLLTWKKERDTINDKYDPQIKEIKLKSEANNIAYSNLIDKITKVQTNIKNNL